jgi:23S rRNA (uracil1939-C5)-methyltransferase
MGRKNKKNGQIFSDIEIIRSGSEGKSIGKHDGKVIFVERAVPGDVADIYITSDRKGYMEGYIHTLKKEGEGRLKPFCQHWDICGGCQWQQMDYINQLKWKQQQVIDAFERIAKVPIKNFIPIQKAPDTVAYRNKVQFTFSAKAYLKVFDRNNPEHLDVKSLGYFVPGKFDKIFDVEYCHLIDEKLNNIRNSLRDFCLLKEYTFFDFFKKKGFMRGLLLRNSTLGETLVMVIFGEENQADIDSVMRFLEEKFPEITSLHHVINEKVNDTYNDLEITTSKGPGYIEEKLGNLIFSISPKSFFQTNSKQAKTLYDITKEFAQLTGKEHVYDLYCGTGTIGLYVSDLCQKVTGIEYIEDAVLDANSNAIKNHITNAQFFAGDMVKVLDDDFVKTHGKPDVIITDPPRAGMHEDVVKKILELEPEKIVYVSCNPATQSRDIQWLSSKYDVEQVQPVDMFPHTHHVENVALLVKRL